MTFLDEPIKYFINVFLMGYPVEITNTMYYNISHYFSISF